MAAGLTAALSTGANTMPIQNPTRLKYHTVSCLTLWSWHDNIQPTLWLSQSHWKASILKGLWIMLPIPQPNRKRGLAGFHKTQQQLRTMFCLENKYQTNKDFNKNVIQRAQAELKASYDKSNAICTLTWTSKGEVLKCVTISKYTPESKANGRNKSLKTVGKMDLHSAGTSFYLQERP